MGDLEVEVGGATVWSKSGDKGSQWHTAHVDFQAPYPTTLTFKFDVWNNFEYQYVSWNWSDYYRAEVRHL